MRVLLIAGEPRTESAPKRAVNAFPGNTKRTEGRAQPSHGQTLSAHAGSSCCLWSACLPALLPAVADSHQRARAKRGLMELLRPGHHDLAVDEQHHGAARVAGLHDRLPRVIDMDLRALAPPGGAWRRADESRPTIDRRSKLRCRRRAKTRPRACRVKWKAKRRVALLAQARARHPLPSARLLGAPSESWRSPRPTEGSDHRWHRHNIAASTVAKRRHSPCQASVPRPDKANSIRGKRSHSCHNGDTTNHVAHAPGILLSKAEQDMLPTTDEFIR